MAPLSTRVVTAGRVNCPRNGDVDVERCFQCDRLEAIDLKEERSTIECKPQREIFFVPLTTPFEGF